MNDKKKVIENSILYTISTVLVKGIGFILLPIYTLFISPEQYGVINLATNFINVAIFIVGFSLYAAVLRFYIDYRDEPNKLRKFYGTLIIFILFSGVGFLVISLIFRNWLTTILFKGVPFFPIVLITIITVIFTSFHTIHQNIFRSMQRGKTLTKINLTVFSLQVTLNIIFISIFRLGAFGVVISTLMVEIGYTVFMLYSLKKNNLVIYTFDKKILKDALSYSIPLIPHNLSTYIATFASKIFINNNSTLAAVGLYSVATQFSGVIDLIQNSVNQAFMPWFFESMKLDCAQRRNDILNFTKFLLIIYSILYMIIGLFSQDILQVITTSSYSDAWLVTPILVMAYSLKSIYYFYINLMFYYKEASRKIFIATIIGSISNIIIALLLIPYLGMFGAAISFLIAKIITVAIVVVLSKKYNDIGYSIISMLKIIAPSLLFMGVGLYFSYTKYISTFNLMNLFYKLGVLIAYLIFVYCVNRKMINKVIKSKKIQQIFKRKKNILDR